MDIVASGDRTPPVHTRQFQQLANLPSKRRLPLLVEGLNAVGNGVERIAAELKTCSASAAHKAAALMRNTGKEEAGKFLILIDPYRSPASRQKAISTHFARAGNHIAKLIYGQIADYSIASRSELVRAVENLRPSLHLDGPNDFDWIVPNELIAERESALYVDLVEAEGELFWSSPSHPDSPSSVPQCMELVLALMKTGVVSAAGLQALTRAWHGFDPAAETRWEEWADRSRSALELIAPQPRSPDWESAAAYTIEHWPMPMVEIAVSRINLTTSELEAQRAAEFKA